MRGSKTVVTVRPRALAQRHKDLKTATGTLPQRLAVWCLAAGHQPDGASRSIKVSLPTKHPGHATPATFTDITRKENKIKFDLHWKIKVFYDILFFVFWFFWLCFIPFFVFFFFFTFLNAVDFFYTFFFSPLTFLSWWPSGQQKLCWCVHRWQPKGFCINVELLN